MRRLRIGFIPLVDSAGLVAAAEMGFAQAEDLELELQRETSWAALRDKLAVGAIDAAHLLAPIAVASKVYPGNAISPTVALMSLSVNGNAISVSRPLFDAMAATGRFTSPADLLGKGRALAEVIAQRRESGLPRLTFAVVHTFSTHNYELRYLLAAAGIDPDVDVDLVVVPPPFVVDHLRDGLIDGFCVGAPWTSVGVAEGLTRVIAVKPQIWRFGPEKVLGIREDVVAQNEDMALRLIRAVKAGSEWADDPANREALAQMLAAPERLSMPQQAIDNSLAGRVPLDDATSGSVDDYVVFGRDGASFPWRSHALWFYSQMVRWGQVEHSPAHVRAAAEAYRPDLYRRALEGRGVALPASDDKLEGVLSEPFAADGSLGLPRDGFFDGRVFDPAQVEAYIAGFREGTGPRT